MEKVKLEMTHCYGIKDLVQEIDFSNGHKAAVLYAPNGMMKTSLAKSFHDYIDGNQPVDKIFPNNESAFSVTCEENNPIDPEKLFVIDSINEKYQSERISTLLASEELKSQYDSIFDEISLSKDRLTKPLKKLSGIATGVDKVFTSDYNLPANEFVAAVARLEREVNLGKYAEFSDIKYKVLFNDKVLKYLEDPKFKDLVEEYTNVYEEMLDNSRYFKKGVFNHSNAETIAKQLKSNKWFEGGHSVSLKDSEGNLEIFNEDDLVSAIEGEKEAILKDDTLKNMFTKVDKAFSNAELKAFRDYLIKNPFIVPELDNIQYFKNKIWISYFGKCKSEFDELVSVYDKSESELSRIISEAESQQTHWEQVIETFNQRFSVPFTVKIENKGDAVLNRASPQIAFYFNDSDGEPIKKISKGVLDDVLSNGEKRALYILNIIFEVQARKRSELNTLFIVDDIADSFDYKNKYAIIEYLSEIKEDPLFKIFILTHNFDFYRSVKSRIGVYGNNKMLASKSGETISIDSDTINDNPFNTWKDNLDNKYCLIASIPFVRNLAEYLNHKDVFDNLTSLLHIKRDSYDITFGTLKKIFTKLMKDEGGLEKIPETQEKIIDSIFLSCDELVEEEIGGLELDKKIVLSVGIRLLAERIMIDKISNIEWVYSIKKHQTGRLIRKYCQKEERDSELVKLLKQVSLMTPENIHLNSFMFEPILDMSSHHLKSLYLNLKNKE